MAAPAAALGARTAVRYRRPLAALAVVIGAIMVLPVLAVVAAVGGLSGGPYAPSDAVIADIPANYLALYRGAATRAGIDWAVLAAIGKIECDHGRNRDPGCRPFTANTAGAVGPMQFLPPTWAAGHAVGETRVAVAPSPNGAGYATDGDGDGIADVWNPADAIAGAARMLVANGAPGDYRRALLAYNHANWYVDEVLKQAQRYRGAWAGAMAGAGPVGAWAQQYLGTAYVWGGNHGADPPVMLGTGAPQPAVALDGRTGYFDCSSLTSWAFAKSAHRFIGDTTDQQWAMGATARGAARGTAPPPGGFRPGDLVFFHGFDHVGIYLGNDLFIHAPHTGANVEIARFSTYPDFAGWVRYGRSTGGT